MPGSSSSTTLVKRANASSKIRCDFCHCELLALSGGSVATAVEATAKQSLGNKQTFVPRRLLRRLSTLCVSILLATTWLLFKGKHFSQPQTELPGHPGIERLAGDHPQAQPGK